MRFSFIWLGAVFPKSWSVTSSEQNRVRATHTSTVATHSSTINSILLKFLFLERLICVHVALCKKLAEYMIAPRLRPRNLSIQEAIVLDSFRPTVSALGISPLQNLYNYALLIYALICLEAFF